MIIRNIAPLALGRVNACPRFLNAAVHQQLLDRLSRLRARARAESALLGLSRYVGRQQELEFGVLACF